MVKLVALLLVCLATATSLRLPAIASRRAALGGGAAALLLPLAAQAKYRPSLADFKGYGSSPYVDEANAGEGVKTDLSHAQLVANSVAMQEKMVGRKLTDEEVKVIDDKIRKYYPNAAK